MADRVSAFPQESLDRLTALLDEAQGLLAAHGVVLSPDERMELPKMGDKSEAFVRKSVRYTAEHPELVPGFLDAEELASDYEAAKALDAVAERLVQLTDVARDTATAAGSDAQSSALVFYRSVKAAVQAGSPAAEAVFEDLRARFDRPSRSEAPTA